MERNPIFNPVREDVCEMAASKRHVLCPLYDACLDEAVERNQCFTCCECFYKINKIVAPIACKGLAA